LLPILHKNHAQTSREKLKGKFLTEINRKGSLQKKPVLQERRLKSKMLLSLDKLGKKQKQKSTMGSLAWQKHLSARLQNA